jgi:uncharacterized phosphosugar-binding protein
MLAKRYLEKASELLERLTDTQLQNIEKAAEIIAEASVQGHTFYAWGGPHSSLPVQDIFMRAGGSGAVNAVFTPGLCLERGPIWITSFLERAEGYGREFFGKIGAEAHDVILLVSTSGRNAFPIEMAMAAQEAGLKVIGMTSMDYTTAVASRHSSGKKMYQYCDVVLDNLTVPGDAVLEDDRMPQKVGPTSGWIGCLLLQALMVEVAERMYEKGMTPPIYIAGNLDGYDEYRQYLDALRKERSTKFGGIYSPRRKM